MDDFWVSYLVLTVIALLAFLGFWGVVIYLIIGFIQEKTHSLNQQKLDIINKGMHSYRSHKERERLFDTEKGELSDQDSLNLDEVRS